MTDKELKKLSRLELLEILLEESKENERLRELLDKPEKENSPGYSEGGLVQLTEQLNSALSEANRLVYELGNMRRENITVEDVASPPVNMSGGISQGYPAVYENPVVYVCTQPAVTHEAVNSANISEENLYYRLMNFYSQNEMALAFLPPDIQADVRTILRGTTNAGK